MIIPSIDLQNGHAVQLIGGKEKALDAGDPCPIAECFGRVGEVAVIDLDAALGTGSNRETILDLLKRAPCRVGGGIRDLKTARFWLDAGARKIILGTAAEPELLSQLPRDRVIAALDAVDGDIVVEGWTKKTGRGVLDRMQELKAYVGGFLVTFVEREGRLGGIDESGIKELVDAADDAALTVAGGVATAQDVGRIDALGADAQVGMALYTNRFDLADATAACLKTDREDGLWTTVVVDESGLALGLAYSDVDSLRVAINEGKGAYHSRSRNALWIKGATSGAVQKLHRIELDCDRDTLRFSVSQSGPGFCHLERSSCWGDSTGLQRLESTLWDRKTAAVEGSYTGRLLAEEGLLAAKLGEEAEELAQADGVSEVIHEAADLIYFAMVAMARAGVRMTDVESELDRRALKITRRSGNPKASYQGGN
ncbi:MAG: phosphoribosyl-ATP diphosphatase [Arenicellales bacterium]|jgi:phosphoribosyl-ATP pyrophosphohydrolase|nr:phosphoribosyl-ATP diphosphatase [Arenicellales bacterium]|tara:strand:- start:13888 stop:15165 length:1278 start_codon:yes stop_codon:yes gene_type:complete